MKTGPRFLAKVILVSFSDLACWWEPRQSGHSQEMALS